MEFDVYRRQTKNERYRAHEEIERRKKQVFLSADKEAQLVERLYRGGSGAAAAALSRNTRDETEAELDASRRDLTRYCGALEPPSASSVSARKALRHARKSLQLETNYSFIINQKNWRLYPETKQVEDEREPKCQTARKARESDRNCSGVLSFRSCDSKDFSMLRDTSNKMSSPLAKTKISLRAQSEFLEKQRRFEERKQAKIQKRLAE